MLNKTKKIQTGRLTRKVLPTLACLAAAALAFGCETHDYWAIETELSINGGDGDFMDELKEPLSQQNFVRYGLDFEVINHDTETESECVVEATSFINGYERVSHTEVIQMKPGATYQGIMTEAQLQYGNAINVSLQCCLSSRCLPQDVVCPVVDDVMYQSEEAYLAMTYVGMGFCLESCQDRSVCEQNCPTKSACSAYCSEKNAQISNCEETYCINGSGIETCAILCEGSEDEQKCLEECEPADICRTQCISDSLTCFSNCVATWGLCTSFYYFGDSSAKVPCAVCGGTGACDFSKDTEVYALSNGSQTWTCENFDCDVYPPECLTGCEELYPYEEDGIEAVNCLLRCMDQQAYWCSGKERTFDYIDYSVKQPCCFTNTCNNTMTGVIRTSSVECYVDTHCGSNRVCNAQGVCEDEASSSNCQNAGQVGMAWYLCLPVAFFCILKRRKRKYA